MRSPRLIAMGRFTTWQCFLKKILFTQGSDSVSQISTFVEHPHAVKTQPNRFTEVHREQVHHLANQMTLTMQG